LISNLYKGICLSIYVLAEGVIFKIVGILLECLLERADLTTFKEPHCHGEFLAFVTSGNHELKLVIEMLQHVLLFLGCTTDLLVADVVDLRLDLGYLLLQLLRDEIVQPLFIFGELSRVTIADFIVLSTI